MTGRQPLRFLGADVVLRERLPDGRAVIAFACAGAPLPCTAEVWPHELRGVGWHIAAIKQAIARLPLAGSHSTPAPAAPAPRALLYAHHVANHQRED